MKWLSNFFPDWRIFDKFISGLQKIRLIEDKRDVQRRRKINGQTEKNLESLQYNK